MSSWFAGALLQGIGAGGVAYGKGMAEEAAQQRRDEEQRRREEAQIARDRERERAADERQQSQLAARTSAAGGSGGGGRSGFNSAEFEGQMAKVFPDEAAVRSGSFFDKNREIPASASPARMEAAMGSEGYGPTASDVTTPATTETYREEGWEKLRAEKLKEPDLYRMAAAVGPGNFDDVTKGRLNEQQRDQLDRFEKGSTRAGEAAALSKKGEIYGGNSDVTRNQVSGETALTPVGNANIRKKGEEADAADALARKRDRETAGGSKGGGGKAADPASMNLKEVESERKRLDTAVRQAKDAYKDANSGNREERLAAYDRARTAFQQFNERVSKDPEKVAPAPALTPAPKPAAAAPKPSFWDRVTGSSPAPGAPVKVTSQAERDKLAPGTPYYAPDGQLKIKR